MIELVNYDFRINFDSIIKTSKMDIQFIIELEGSIN
jgi:hypothetical protein